MSRMIPPNLLEHGGTMVNNSKIRIRMIRGKCVHFLVQTSKPSYELISHDSFSRKNPLPPETNPRIHLQHSSKNHLQSTTNTDEILRRSTIDSLSLLLFFFPVIILKPYLTFIHNKVRISFRYSIYHS